MQNYMQTFKDSAKEFKSLRTLTVTALFIAVGVVLDAFVDIQLTPWLRVNFTFLPIAIVGMLFGPAVSMTSGALNDLLSCMLFPKGAYFPGFTLTALLDGLIFGLLLYKKKPSIPRCFVADGIVCLFTHTLLNTVWLTMMMGKGYLALLPVRLGKNAAAWPLESLLLYAVLILIQQVERRTLSRSA